MNRLLPLLIAVVIAVVAFSSSVFIVRERDYALVFALGEVKKVISEPGLYFKLPPPLQNVVTLDKRLLTIDLQEAERIQTSEKKNLLIDSFVKWRIVDPRLYYVTFGGNERAARERLQAQIRLKRIEFAPEIAESVFRRMESERIRVANEQRSIGAAEGEKIRAEADRQREQIVAEAYGRAQAIMGEGDAQAAGIYAKAYGEDLAFYSFYKSLEGYRASFGKPGDVLVVDPSSDFFKYLKSSSGK